MIERVKMTGAYPQWIGPRRLNQREKKGENAGGLYMEMKTLSQWRRERGLTVKDVADKLGLAESSCRDILNYSKPAPYKTRFLLLHILNVENEQVIWEPQDVVLPDMPRSPEFVPTKENVQVSQEQYEIALQWVDAGRSKTEIAEAMGVSRGTLYKAFKRYEPDHEAAAKAEAKAAKLKKQKATSAAKVRKAGATPQAASVKGKEEKPSSRSRKAAKAVQ